ncbi:rho guanine nucleotide exchange factor 39 isoform X2 [Ahaetulla prasina]|uniref:rho guanine nucleotide exchange factor 39 isoform X2 n=1 Tax=Ahaetulla prasina TaxID=499056 RepID=UPI00264794E0|nr:rho guanine nucleotide exchange factor 39 isoform X2 [Ahaetulla prasina]
MSADATGPLGHSRSSSPEGRAGWERKLRGRAEELLRTEGRYLEDLEGVATVRRRMRRQAAAPLPRLSRVPGLPWMWTRSGTLLFHLTRGHFALGLESFCHQLVFYVHYAENLEAAQNILKKLVKKNKAFSRFKKLQESRPELKGCRLEELLSLPLQRLHQYRHLLQDLVEHTPPESSGFDQLQGSLKSVLEVLHRVQEIARVHENLLMMRQIQKQLKGRKTQVLAPGRRYLQEGWLMEVPSKGKEMQRRRCFLFSDILLLTKPCHPLHPWNSHKFACQAVYPLSHCVVEKVFGHTQSQGGLLSLSFPQKKLLLMSCDQEDFAKWHQNLVVAIRELQVCCSLPSQKAE